MQLTLAARNGDVATTGILDALVPLDYSVPAMSRDPLLERLVRALLPAEDAGIVLRGFYTDVLHATLLRRLAGLRDDAETCSGGRKSIRLPAWRLKKVSEYVEANLDGPLPLAALARTAGLSCMYFAAQFRLATGMRPHDYIIRRRIHRAKAMLRETETPIVDVALSVGFQSQSHFTTVFKRIVGFTPLHWRVLNDRRDPIADEAHSDKYQATTRSRDRNDVEFPGAYRKAQGLAGLAVQAQG